MKNNTINTFPCFSEKYSNKFILNSTEIKETNFEIKRCAHLEYAISLIGESGECKDREVQEIHKMSQRKNNPFLCVLIHSLNKTSVESELFGYEKAIFSDADRNNAGRFETTDSGTIYPPEISDLSESFQLKLLYFIQRRTITRIGQNPYQGEKTIDVRLIFAANKKATYKKSDFIVENGKMNSDFYNRINVRQINMPLMRQRRDRNSFQILCN